MPVYVFGRSRSFPALSGPRPALSHSSRYKAVIQGVVGNRSCEKFVYSGSDDSLDPDAISLTALRMLHLAMSDALPVFFLYLVKNESEFSSLLARFKPSFMSDVRSELASKVPFLVEGFGDSYRLSSQQDGSSFEYSIAVHPRIWSPSNWPDAVLSVESGWANTHLNPKDASHIQNAYMSGIRDVHFMLNNALGYDKKGKRHLDLESICYLSDATPVPHSDIEEFSAITQEVKKLLEG